MKKFTGDQKKAVNCTEGKGEREGEEQEITDRKKI